MVPEGRVTAVPLALAGPLQVNVIDRAALDRGVLTVQVTALAATAPKGSA
jgi:hypothetical protein